MIEFPRDSHALFVCNASINRSPMAAAVFTAKMKAHSYPCRVETAALLSEMEGMPASRAWRAVVPAKAYDLSQHRSRFLGKDGVYTPETFFFCMDELITYNVKCFPKVDASRVHIVNGPQGVIDPQGFGTPAYVDCFTQIYAGVDKLIKKLDMR